MKSFETINGYPTAIGRAFKGGKPLTWTSLTVSVVVISLDLLKANDEFAYIYRTSLLVVGGGLLLFISKFDFESLGLATHPVQGWRCWLLRLSVFFLFTLLVAAVWLPLTRNQLDQSDLNWKFESLTEFWKWWVLQCCIAIPLIEESLYRVILCSPLQLVFGSKATIAISTLVFGFLHWRYGILSPINVIGGFLLTWAYLISETVLVPLLLHALTNFAFGLFHLP